MSLAGQTVLNLLTGLQFAVSLATTVATPPIPPYYTTNDLGSVRKRPNPLKGFLTSPSWTAPPYNFPSHLEFYYIGLNEVMTGNNTFDWNPLEFRLDDTAYRESHAIMRFFLDYPAKETGVPQYLIDGGLVFHEYDEYGGGQSPDYEDENLVEALKQFITAFGGRYDGDPRVGFVQVGLLGFWGEWHTYTDGSGVTENWIPPTLKDTVVDQFNTAFSTTPLQTRVPWPTASASGFGLHDDSFAHSTLDGEANGGVITDWFFWPQVESASYTDFWESAVMGGELRPELQGIIFTDAYPANTEYHQDFQLCVNVTHATYMLNYHIFGCTAGEDEIERAQVADAAMGYSFQVTEVEVGVSAASTTETFVDITVTVDQTGIAPFYYPLGLTLSCTGLTPSSSRLLPGVETIIAEGDSRKFTFENIPATEQCLGRVSIGLSSAYVYPNRPVRFAQGDSDDDGTEIVVVLPLPPSSMESPSSAPSSGPISTLSLIPSSESTIRCYDALLPMHYNGNVLSCEQISSFGGCILEVAQSHCPNTCNACPEYKCEDSLVPLSAVRSYVCADLQNLLSDAQIEEKCRELVQLATTCRGTCKICDI